MKISFILNTSNENENEIGNEKKAFVGAGNTQNTYNTKRNNIVKFSRRIITLFYDLS